LKSPKKPTKSQVAVPLGAPQSQALPVRLKTPPQPKERATEVYEHKLLTKDKYPLRSKSHLPDPHADVNEKAKAELGLWPYGQNIVVAKADLVTLQNFYLSIRDIPIPNQVLDLFDKQHALLRKVLQLIPLEDLEDQFKQDMASYEGPKRYQCKCFKAKK
jgi:hypothetical protein